jgi:hypothetical protein
MTLHRVVSVGPERGAIAKGASSRPRLIQLRTAPGRGRQASGRWSSEWPCVNQGWGASQSGASDFPE